MVATIVTHFTINDQAVIPGKPIMNGQVCVQEYDVWEVEDRDVYPPISLDVLPKGEPHSVVVSISSRTSRPSEARTAFGTRPMLKHICAFGLKVHTREQQS